MTGHDLESLSTFLQKATHRYGIAPDGTWQAPSLARLANQANSEPPSPEQATIKQPSLSLDASWCDAARIFQSGQMVRGIVTGWNRGGLLVRWNDLQGFVPASQLKEVPVFESDDARDDKLARWVGEELRLKVIELDRSRNRLVFSERATIWGPKDGERLLSEVTPGETRCGYVSNLCDFGAFVDIGAGRDGLLHISELSTSRVHKVTDVVQEGQEVTVWIKELDRERNRISLSMISPDTKTIRDLAVGELVTGTVTRLTNYGAFLDIGLERDAMLHVKEMGDGYVAKPEDVVKLGEVVEARISGVDPRRGRIDLSLKGLRQAATSDASQSEVYLEPVAVELEDEELPSAMEMAFRMALSEEDIEYEMEKASRKSGRRRRNNYRDQQDDIVSRTLRYNN